MEIFKIMNFQIFKFNFKSRFLKFYLKLFSKNANSLKLPNLKNVKKAKIINLIVKSKINEICIYHKYQSPQPLNLSKSSLLSSKR